MVQLTLHRPTRPLSTITSLIEHQTTTPTLITIIIEPITTCSKDQVDLAVAPLPLISQVLRNIRHRTREEQEATVRVIVQLDRAIKVKTSRAAIRLTTGQTTISTCLMTRSKTR